MEIMASEFKAKCLALLDEVERTGEPLVILKRGKPVAQLVPVRDQEQGLPQEQLFGSVEIVGDVVGPALPAEAWEVLSEIHEP